MRFLLFISSEKKKNPRSKAITMEFLEVFLLWPIITIIDSLNLFSHFLSPLRLLSNIEQEKEWVRRNLTARMRFVWFLTLACFVSEKHNCSSSEFLCVNNMPPSRRCIPQSWVCDGDMDCADGYDERQNCTRGSCSENDFTCSNGQCVPDSYRWMGIKILPRKPQPSIGAELTYPLGVVASVPLAQGPFRELWHV